MIMLQFIGYEIFLRANEKYTPTKSILHPNQSLEFHNTIDMISATKS